MYESGKMNLLKLLRIGGRGVEEKDGGSEIN
jgi:hypothetical protein